MERPPLPRPWRPLVGLLVSALVLEVTLRLLLAIPALRQPIVLHTPWDLAAELDWYHRWVAHRARGGTGLGPGAVHDPELGWLPSHDAEGFRPDGTRDGGLPRAPGAVRVALVGDSFAYGTDVEVQDTLGDQLEARRADVDVLNLAVWGYGHDQMARRTARDAPALRPDVVVLLGIGADIPRAGFRFFAYAKPHLVADDLGGVRLEGLPVPSPEALGRRVFLRSRTWDLLRLAGERRARSAVPQEVQLDRAEVLAAHALDRWVDAVRDLGALPVLVSVPTPQDLQELRPGLADAHPVARARAFYARWCADADFPCVDAWDAVAARMPEPPAFLANAHWNRAGHGVVAEVLEAALVEAGVLPDARAVDAGP